MSLDHSIFRAYDIRGIVDHGLDSESVYQIALTLGSIAQASGENDFVIGRDGRLSSLLLSRSLSQGLLDAGINVIDLGLVSTPMLNFAIHELLPNSGVMLTASHNPAEYNGLKIIFKKSVFCGEKLQNLYHQALSHTSSKKSPGHYDSYDIRPQYLEKIKQGIKLKKKIKVVVDCGNGVTGLHAPQLLESLGATVIPLFCEVDGRFPNHEPDPINPDNLATLITTVQNQHADLGIALDGDGDRLVVVTSQGEIIWPDRLLILFAEDLLNRHPGSTIIFDVKSSNRLEQVIRKKGGVPLIWRTGHSFIRNKMQEMGALLAGEMSGHIFFKENWYGFDDGLYAAALLLQILTKSTESAHSIFAALPTGIVTPETKISIQESEKAAFMQSLLSQTDYPENAALNTLDGLRIDLPDAWGLVRVSNTTPHLTLRFEGDTPTALDHIKSLMKDKIARVNPKLIFPE